MTVLRRVEFRGLTPDIAEVIPPKVFGDQDFSQFNTDLNRLRRAEDDPEEVRYNSMSIGDNQYESNMKYSYDYGNGITMVAIDNSRLDTPARQRLAETPQVHNLDNDAGFIWFRNIYGDPICPTRDMIDLSTKAVRETHDCVVRGYSGGEDLDMGVPHWREKLKFLDNMTGKLGQIDTDAIDDRGKSTLELKEKRFRWSQSGSLRTDVYAVEVTLDPRGRANFMTQRGAKWYRANTGEREMITREIHQQVAQIVGESDEKTMLETMLTAAKKRNDDERKKTIPTVDLTTESFYFTRPGTETIMGVSKDDGQYARFFVHEKGGRWDSEYIGAQWRDPTIEETRVIFDTMIDLARKNKDDHAPETGLYCRVVNHAFKTIGNERLSHIYRGDGEILGEHLSTVMAPADANQWIKDMSAKQHERIGISRITPNNDK